MSKIYFRKKITLTFLDLLLATKNVQNKKKIAVEKNPTFLELLLATKISGRSNALSNEIKYIDGPLEYKSKCIFQKVPQFSSWRDYEVDQ